MVDLRHDNVWLGVIVGGLLSASVVERVGVEPVSTCLLALGAVCALSIGVLDLPLWLLSLIICGSGIGIGGCQSGVNSLSGGIYPPAIRSTGAGWALGSGRVGTVAGPLLGGGLLMLGWHAQGIFLAAALPTFGAMLLMAMLGRVRGRW